jgi:predicted PurR-regulated permease PerM
MIGTKGKYRTCIVLALFLGLLSVTTLSVTDPLFTQGQNQTTATAEKMQAVGNQTNQTGEAMQAAGNETVEGVQKVGNATGEGVQGVANETGEFLGNVSKGVQEFFNKGGQNQSG